MTHPDRGATAPLLSSDTASTLGPASSRSSFSDHDGVSPWSKIARRAASVRRAISFVAAVVAALCGGSITVFSMYGHIFQERLHYNQFQVNGLAISSSIALYLPVSLLGYVCDRVGTAPLSGLAAVLFGVGYGLAAAIYRHLERRLGRLGENGGGGARDDWSYPLIVLAFVFIGVGTCAMYLAAVATCAKNFGRGKHRGLALAVPIASFGLSGMWLSQVGSRLFCERRADGSAGDLDVFRFFVFLAVLLSAIGVLGVFTLKVVDEDELIDAAVEELERSGLLDGSSLLGGGSRGGGGGQAPNSYGTLRNSSILVDEANDVEDEAGILDPSKDLEDDDDPNWKKNWVLNAETRRFLSDHTMWCLAFGFLLMIGPGEAFINNLGTIIGTLYRAAPSELGVVPTSAATHVSIVGVTSTAARLLTGSLTDLLAPSPATQHLQFAPAGSVPPPRRFQVSRVVFLLFFGLVLSIGLVALASGLIQDHAGRFWIVSGFAGAGYGAVFSLTPIIITVIWGVENFATNWGIVATFPALGATFWGLVYSAVYQAGARRDGSPGGDGSSDDLFCHGRQCYAPTFWAMAGTVWLACLLVFWAWKGPNGWARRGIVI